MPEPVTHPGAPSGAPVPNLAGDRALEWAYVAARIGRYVKPPTRVLDFGCGDGTLSFTAASLGASVLAIDLMPRRFEVVCPNVEFRQADVMELPDSEQFDLILNCSTIEHVGLAGRYNAKDSPDGDLAAMEKLSRLLRPAGVMLMTLPVGLDRTVSPLHRIYGPRRLPRLLRGWEPVEASFWFKDERNAWLPCTREEAMAQEGNDHYYALGLMVLRLSKAC